MLDRIKGQHITKNPEQDKGFAYNLEGKSQVYFGLQENVEEGYIAELSLDFTEVNRCIVDEEYRDISEQLKKISTTQVFLPKEIVTRLLEADEQLFAAKSIANKSSWPNSPIYVNEAGFYLKEKGVIIDYQGKLKIQPNQGQHAIQSNLLIDPEFNQLVDEYLTLKSNLDSCRTIKGDVLDHLGKENQVEIPAAGRIWRMPGTKAILESGEILEKIISEEQEHFEKALSNSFKNYRIAIEQFKSAGGIFAASLNRFFAGKPNSELTISETPNYTEDKSDFFKHRNK